MHAGSSDGDWRITRMVGYDKRGRFHLKRAYATPTRQLLAEMSLTYLRAGMHTDATQKHGLDKFSVIMHSSDLITR
jgi:hypothetical protein